MPTTKKTKQIAQPSTTGRRAGQRAPQSPAESDIAKRAYQLFVARGGQHGRDLDDWLLAKQELLSADR